MVDAATPDPERRIAAVRGVLDELGISDTPELLVFNQVDRLPEDDGEAGDGRLCVLEGATGKSVWTVPIPGHVQSEPAICDLDGDQVVGEVTSGGPAPTLGGAVGMAYVPKALAGPGKPLTLRQRNKTLAATQVKGPFYRRPAT